ncbi:MAG: DUF2147 domain-containing protein [Pseudomonadota bacterium]
MLKRVVLGPAMVILAVMLGATIASADPIVGEWRSEPDAKGQTGIIEIVPCGGAFCGTIVRAQDSGGQPVVTRNVGRQIVSDLRPAGDGSYAGRVYVPMMNADFPATVLVSGGQMRVEGCNSLGICMKQTLRQLP